MSDTSQCDFVGYLTPGHVGRLMTFTLVTTVSGCAVDSVAVNSKINLLASELLKEKETELLVAVGASCFT